MRRDPTQFRERFKQWKNGEKVYEAGLPKYKDGKDDLITNAANALYKAAGYYKQQDDGTYYVDPTFTLPVLTADINTDWQRELSYKKALEVYADTKKAEMLAKGAERAKILNPSSWAGAAINAVTGSDTFGYSQGLGNPVVNLAFDVAAPIGVKTSLNKYKLFKKTLNRRTTPIAFYPENVAKNIAEKNTPMLWEAPNRVEKAAFMQNYMRFAKNTELKRPSIKDINDIITQPATTTQLLNRLQRLIVNNPEYMDYLLWRYNNNPAIKIDPYAQSTLDDFFNRQGTSLRGVHASSEEDAIKYLTEAEKGRPMPGGDRLDTDGGLYTSNSPTVADTFKNSYRWKDVLDGYVGTLHGDLNISKNLTPEEQLFLYRQRIFPASNSNPLGGTVYYGTAVDDAINNGAVALEADYVGNANKGLPGYERAYLPESKYGVTKPVKIKKLEKYEKAEDKAGRWMNNGLDAGHQDDLFISRQLNTTTDFIKLSKSFLKGRRVKDYENIAAKEKELTELFNKQKQGYLELLGNLRKKLMRYYKISTASKVIPVSIASGVGISSFIKNEIRKN